MRILFINPTSKIGGAELGLIELIRHLDKRRSTAVVFLPRGPGLGDRLRQMGVSVSALNLRRFRRTRNVFVFLGYLLHLMYLIPRIVLMSRRCGGVDIVHANGTNAQIYGFLVAKILGVPSIWHLRDIVPLGRVGKILLRHSTRVVAPSDAVIKSLPPDPGGKAVRIYNGVDLESFRTRSSYDGDRKSNVRDEFGISRDEALIVKVAHLVPWKGHEVFIRAAARVVRTHPDAHFLLVGEDLFGRHRRYSFELRTLCEDLGLAERMHFTGYRSDNAAIVRDADLLVHTSRNEPFGRVVVEAMALGKPVVASNEGGPAEIVVDGETGILVAPGDDDAAARAILALIDDPSLREQMGSAGRRRVDELFNITQHVGEIERLYAEISASGRKS